MDNLFNLDIDDDIWQDVGLTEADNSSEPPLWLCDDNIRMGIRAMLERDHCLEEEARLIKERWSLQEWFAEEWKILDGAIKATGMCKFISVCLLKFIKMKQPVYCTSSDFAKAICCVFVQDGRNHWNH